MTQSTKEQLSIDYAPDLPAAIAAALWRLEDGRSRTLNTIKEISQAHLDWEPPNYANGIGTLLYHIALIEADWLFTEVLQSDYGDAKKWFPYDDRNTDGRLTPIKGEPLADHLVRLKAIRHNLLAVFHPMSLDDFRRPREMEHYDVTPEWVLHHVSQHEDEHRGEIMMLHTLARAARL